MLGFGAVSERPLSALSAAAVTASSVLMLFCGYVEAAPEEPLESTVYQVIENVSLSGSGTATESGDTSSGSGSQSTTGTGSPTESADTASGAGTQSLTGSGATTEGADTASGTGTASTTGSGTATETSDTSSGTGTASTSGSGAVTEGADTASGTGSQAGASAVMLRAGYYEVAPERVEVYGSFLSFVAQVAGTTGTGSATETGDTASGTGTSQGDAVLVLDFQDEDWDRELEDASLSLIFEEPSFAGSGTVTEDGDTANGTGSAPNRGGYYCGELRDFAHKTLTKRQIAEQRKALGILVDFPQQAAAEIVKGLVDPDISSADLDQMQADIASQAERLSRLMGLVIEHQQIMAALELQIRIRRDEELAMLAVIAAYQYQ